MKKLGLALGLATVLFTSCQKEEEVDVYNDCSATITYYEYVYLSATDQAIMATQSMGVNWDDLTPSQKSDAASVFTTKNYTRITYEIHGTGAVYPLTHNGYKFGAVGDCVSANDIHDFSNGMPN